jgi:hypothetical protein
MYMNQYLFLVTFLLACGNDPVAVEKLSTAEQTGLCERFFDDVCTAAAPDDFGGFCVPACRASCGDAAASGMITAECTGVTDAQVEECAENATRDLSVCLRGGGCMFDALEATTTMCE